MISMNTFTISDTIPEAPGTKPRQFLSRVVKRKKPKFVINLNHLSGIRVDALSDIILKN